MAGSPSQDLGRVAARLAVDGAYRQRCRQGLQAAVAGRSSGVEPPTDVLGRVRRLNQYLSTGLMLDDGEDGASADSSLSPLPWQQPAQPPPPLPAGGGTRAQPPPSLAGEHSGSESDSELEESQGPEEADLAALLAAAQAAVERRRSQAVLTIQCAWRRHTAQQLLQALQAQRLAANRLVARLLSGAYRRVCGPQRRLARQALVARLGRWRRWLWRVQQKQRRQEQRSHMPQGAGSAEEQQPQEQQQPLANTQQPASEEQAVQRAAEEQQVPAAPGASEQHPQPAAAAPVATLVPSQPHSVPPAAAPPSAPLSPAPAPAAQEPMTTQPQPQPSSIAPTPPQVEPQPEVPLVWHDDGVVEAESTEPPSAASTPRHTPPRSPALPRSVSSRGGGPAQLAGQTLQQGCLQQCLPPPPRTALASPSCFKGQQCATPPRSATPDSSGGWDSPPRTASSGGRTARGHDGSGQAGASGIGGHLYRRLSSIQLLESVQLGVDGTAGSVASQAALEARERVAGRVADLQRSASGGGAGNSKRSIRRVCSSRPAGKAGEGVPSASEPLEGWAE